MAKKFHYTGTCIPERHFTVDISAKLDAVMELIDAGEYFTVNRPRQYGKSTFMFLLAKIWTLLSPSSPREKKSFC
ncbi:MAG: hypothetical protein QTN59_01665 [Candidatus Electrothrix communis]|nr:hypothetical protein [Desulfobulbus sp. US4]WLE97549.1 MAG: hypothetical protein QTN59_01665 [Candidatus Electrothrix communis]